MNAHGTSTGMNDRASSIEVLDGQWELCTEPQFRGSCLVLGPGQHTTLPPALQHQLSSVRPKDGGGWIGGGTDDPYGAAVMLYDGGNFSGKYV